MNAEIDLPIAALGAAGMAAYLGEQSTTERGVILIGSAAAVGLGTALALEEEGVWDGTFTWNPSWTFWSGLALVGVGGFVVASMLHR